MKKSVPEIRFLLLGSLFLAASPTVAEDLLDPVNGAEITHINSQANATTFAAANLIDKDFTTAWRSPAGQYTNDFIFRFGVDYPLRCFDEFSFTGYGGSTSVETFMLLTTNDLALEQDTIPLLSSAIATAERE